MASYIELLRNDVCCHPSHDASSWPSSVSEFAQCLKNELKIPSWLKGPVPYTNKRVIDLLDQLRASDDASNVDLWDDADQSFDDESEKRLYAVFNTALLDCARIRAALEAENLTHTLYPKESFLVILVRNATLDAHSQVFSLEDVPVVLPRHFSGEANPIRKYMKKSFHVPLVVSICQDVAVESESCSEAGHQSTDEKDSSTRSESFRHSPSTLSESLSGSDATRTPGEAEEEQGEIVPSPQFDAHFLAYPSSAVPPAVCHIPVLCMADEEQLPLLMSSLLYQRRVWHISDPLLGFEFSKYDTVIKLFVGWLEDDSSSDRVLPHVHLGEIGTPYELDMSSPSAVLVISRLLCSLESHMFAVHDTARHSVGAIISGTRLYSSLSWRIDTDIRKEDPILENGLTRDTIIQWIQSQKYSDRNGNMPPRKQAKKITSSNSTTSVPTPQHSTSTRPSYSTSPSSIPSNELNLPIPEVQELRKKTGDVVTFCSRKSCSEFAATTEENDKRIFRWMFDRRVIPQCLGSDLEFRKEYTAMTNFIWPEKWNTRHDLPSVDAALEPCVQELLSSVNTLKKRPGAVTPFSEENSPILRILEQSFSAIFQASRRSREKGGLRPRISEAAWRHDHDRLLFDFFIRLVQPSDGDDDVAYTRIGGDSIARLEDPLSRPNLETTLRFPKSDNLQKSVPQKTVHALIRHFATDLDSWIESRGSPEEIADIYPEEADNSAYVIAQFASWSRETNAETEDQTIYNLGEFPSTGRCDALGRLLVKLPDVSSKDISHFPLVVHAAGKEDAVGRGRIEASRSSKTSTKASKSFLNIPAASFGAVQNAKPARYSVPSASFSTSMHSSDKAKVGLGDSVDALVDLAQRLELGRDSTYLELPILTVEYKKASDDLVKGTNQVRMYLTASVKFLQAVGIKDFPVYGVQTDGPIVSLPAAILRADNFVYLFERLVEKLDISTPLGAWHYATILCRLAENHTRILEQKFMEVRENLCVSALRKGSEMQWTMDHQIKSLIAENIGKWPEKVAK